MIRIAVQSKGRLNEESIRLLKSAGIDINENKRRFLLPSTNFPIEILYLRDDDIPLAVSTSVADLGIVGLNEIEERKLVNVHIIRKLGFGMCRLSIALPKEKKYSVPKDLSGCSIATSYPNILKRFLNANKVEANIITIAGSVEMAPSAGMSDAIFDIVSSGGTLVSNGLKEVESVLCSEAVLIGTKSFTDDKRAIVDELLFRFNAIEDSCDMKYLLMNIPEESIDKAIKIVPAMRSPTIMPLAAKGWYSLHSVIKANQMWNKIRELKSVGAEGILVLSVDKIIK